VTDRNSTARLYFAMTLVEVLVAMALLLVVFAAVVPQIRAIQNSWASKRQNVEVIQNGRVLMDHITFNLTQAQKITAVSDSSQTNGYIEFEDNDGNAMRYEMGAGNLVRFGPVGGLSGLAGPVSQLQVTCYDACDLDTPITDVNLIRSVRVQATFTNSAALGRDHTFTAQAYLRTNSLGGGGGGGKTVSEEPLAEFEFDVFKGQNPVLCRIDANHHLCVYKGGTGATGEGWAVVLIVDTGNWTITKGLPFVFDSKACGGPDLKPIDATNYLCVYQGDKGDGYAVILTVNPLTWTISKGTPLEFDMDFCSLPALSQIDSDDYLCAYSGSGNDGMAVILTADAVTGTITRGPTFVFDGTGIGHCALANVDNVHHLCAYSVGTSGGGLATILTVDTVLKTVVREVGFFEFDTRQGMHNELQKIDQNHYLSAYRGWGEKGNTLILTVDTGTWTIGKGTTILYDTKSEYPALAWIAGDDWLLAYSGQRQSEPDIGKAMVLTVNTQTDSVATGTDYIHDDAEGVSPALSKVDDSHFLCAYEGERNDGFATILTIGSRIIP
jgi:type II secretory pathway pseudopilin PulG